MMTPSRARRQRRGNQRDEDGESIRSRTGIRRMAVSSPGQASLAAACVRDAARLLQVPVQLGKFQGTHSH